MIIELYSQRMKRLDRTAVPEVYNYDRIPQAVLNQIAIVMEDAIGPYYEVRSHHVFVPKNANEVWALIIKQLVREHGAPEPMSVENRQAACLKIL